MLLEGSGSDGGRGGVDEDDFAGASDREDEELADTDEMALAVTEVVVAETSAFISRSAAVPEASVASDGRGTKAARETGTTESLGWCRFQSSDPPLSRPRFYSDP